MGDVLLKRQKTSKPPIKDRVSAQKNGGEKVVFSKEPLPEEQKKKEGKKVIN